MTDELQRCMQTKKQGGELNDLMRDRIVFFPCAKDNKPSSMAIMEEVLHFEKGKRDCLRFKYEVRMSAALETGYHDLTSNGKRYLFYDGIGVVTSCLVAIHRQAELGSPTRFIIETQNSWYVAYGFEMTPALKKRRSEIKKYFPKVYEEVFGIKD